MARRERKKPTPAPSTTDAASAVKDIVDILSTVPKEQQQRVLDSVMVLVVFEDTVPAPTKNEPPPPPPRYPPRPYGTAVR